MKLPICWATKTPIPSSELSTTGKGLRPGNGECFKGSLSRRHKHKLAQRDRSQTLVQLDPSFPRGLLGQNLGPVVEPCSLEAPALQAGGSLENSQIVASPAVWKTAATCTAAAIRLLVDLPWLNGMFEMFHVYPLPVKLNSLQLQACSLLVCSGAAQSYLAAGTYDAMPRQLICRIGA